jgi:hypothetical protein
MTDRPAADPLDAAARAAFRRACNRFGGYEAVATVQGVSQRTMERMYARKRTVPPGLARELARLLRAIEPHRAAEQDAIDADALEQWAAVAGAASSSAATASKARPDG